MLDHFSTFRIWNRKTESQSIATPGSAVSGKNRNLYVFAASPYSSHWYLSILRENIRKPEGIETK